MDRKQANVLLAVILETVSEAGALGAPEGPMYAAMMGLVELEDFQQLVEIAVSVGLVKRAGSHLLTITEKGREMVAKIAAARTARAS